MPTVMRERTVRLVIGEVEESMRPEPDYLAPMRGLFVGVVAAIAVWLTLLVVLLVVTE